ncbi:MAG: DUF2147 domain-containing protein [Hyphomicrobiales bacterium]
MRNPFFALSLAAVFWPLAAADAAEENSFGTWLTDDQKAKVELYPCGDAICSKIVWLKDPVDERGKPYRDELNPDPKLKGRPIIGMDILQNTKKIGDKAWTGEIYSPEDGKAYYLKHISLASAKQVEIRGCLSSGWPCRTKYWTRTETPAAPMVASKPAPAPAPVAAAATPRPAATPAAPPRAYAAAPQAAEPAPQPQREAALTRPEPQQAPAYTPPPARAPQRQAAVTPPPAQTYSPPAPQARRPPPETTAAIPRPAPRPMATDRGYHVQVLARQTQRDALQAYSEMQQRYPHLLGSISPNVQMADLGSKGVWYRVRVGPIGEQSLAVNFCNRLKSEGADCIVREP